MYSILYGTYFSIYTHFEMSSATSSKLAQSKILSSGNGLTYLLRDDTKRHIKILLNNIGFV